MIYLNEAWPIHSEDNETILVSNQNISRKHRKQTRLQSFKHSYIGSPSLSERTNSSYLILPTHYEPQAIVAWASSRYKRMYGLAAAGVTHCKLLLPNAFSVLGILREDKDAPWREWYFVHEWHSMTDSYSPERSCIKRELRRKVVSYSWCRHYVTWLEPFSCHSGDRGYSVLVSWWSISNT